MGDEPRLEGSGKELDDSHLSPIEDPLIDDRTDKAVDDIMHADSDELIENGGSTHLPTAEAKPPGWWRPAPSGAGWRRWWRIKPLRWTVLVVVIGGSLAVGVVPSTRYALLNFFGVKVSATVKVIDETSGQPLKGVTVAIDRASVVTDGAGQAKASKLTLGQHQLVIAEPGFTSVEKVVTLGLGSNPLGEFELRAVGVQYQVVVSDFLTGQAVGAAEVSFGDAIAIANEKGKAVLTLPGSERDNVVVAVKRQGYRSEQVTIKALTKKPTTVQLVVAQKVVYISPKDGKNDLYISDVDGRNQELLVAGTGQAASNMALVVSPDGSRAAWVSGDGVLSSQLRLVNLGDGSIITLAQAEQIQLIDWVGSRLVYEQVSASSKTPEAGRFKVVSYDYDSSTRLQLATAERFSSVFSAQGSLFYGLLEAEGSAEAAAFYRINFDGTSRKKLLDKEVWTAYRTGYNVLSLQTADGWSEYNLSSGKFESVSAPAAYVSRGYLDSGSTDKSLWVDYQGGQGVLTIYDRVSGKDVVIDSQNGLTYPVRWLSPGVVVYRVVTGSGAVDYVISTQAAQAARKVADVVNTYGFALAQ